MRTIETSKTFRFIIENLHNNRVDCEILEVVKYTAKKKRLYDKDLGRYVSVKKSWCGDSDGRVVKGFKKDDKKRKCTKLSKEEIKINKIRAKKTLKTKAKRADKYAKDAIKRASKR